MLFKLTVTCKMVGEGCSGPHRLKRPLVSRISWDTNVKLKKNIHEEKSLRRVLIPKEKTSLKCFNAKVDVLINVDDSMTSRYQANIRQCLKVSLQVSL